jgi:hypothetical protein
MNHTLAENIARGRRAIALAQQRGVDTSAWEEALAELERQELLAWASELAEQEVVLPKPLTYVEAPLRTITTKHISRYAAIYLRSLLLAQSNKRTGGWGTFTHAWWQRQEQEALQALLALREAMQDQGGQEPEP